MMINSTVMLEWLILLSPTKAGKKSKWDEWNSEDVLTVRREKHL